MRSFPLYSPGDGAVHPDVMTIRDTRAVVRRCAVGHQPDSLLGDGSRRWSRHLVAVLSANDRSTRER